ncbi:uncharacterized protein [Macrobrachium rosenbergii]
MNQADQINADLQATLQSLRSVQDKKKALLAKFRQTLVEYVETKQGTLQRSLQEHFIHRNNKLERAVNEVQDNLKSAYEAHTKIMSIRDQFVGVFNAFTKPPLTSIEGDSQIDSKLQGLEMAVFERECQIQQWADLKSQEIQGHVAKIRQMLETLANVKYRLESLFQAIGKEKATV